MILLITILIGVVIHLLLLKLKNSIILLVIDKTLFGIRLEWEIILERDSPELLLGASAVGIPFYSSEGRLQAEIGTGIPYSVVRLSWGGYYDDCDCGCDDEVTNFDCGCKGCK